MKTWVRRVVDSQWFPFAQLGCVAVAGGMWYFLPPLGPWPLALALAPWLIHLALTGRLTRRTPLDLPLALFLLTAVASVWAAYDRDGSQAIFSIPIGWRKLWGLILAALLFYTLTALHTEVQRRWMLRLMAGFGAVAAAWFVATNDWAAQPADWELITRLGRAVQTLLPSLPGHRLNPNVAGGLAALLLPTSLELAVEARGKGGREARRWAAWGLATGAAMVFGLLLTTSRAAWLGVGGGAALGAAWCLAGRLGRGACPEPCRRGRRLGVFATLVLLGALVGGLAVAMVPALRAVALESYAFTNRLNILSQSMLLVRDYPFTGCGLGNFPLVHSTYALLIHVPVLVHTHALLLDVAVEQGILGALAMVGVWGWAGWLGLRALAESREPPPGLVAGLLSLAILVIHGLLDDALYGSRGLLLLWVPAGLVVAALPDIGEQRSRSPEQSEGTGAEERGGRGAGEHGSRGARERGSRGAWRWGLAAGAAAALLLLALVGHPLAAAWYSNLGAVAQTQVELPAYDYNHFDNPTLDQIRQQEDLSRAEGYFVRALALDPHQVTARTRLAHIALGRGDYAAALQHAQAAWDAGYRDRVTRLLLGDALVALGEVERGAETVRGLEWAEMRLSGQAWYRYWVNQDWQRAAYAWRAVLLLDPQDAYARAWVGQAEERAAQNQ